MEAADAHIVLDRYGLVVDHPVDLSVASEVRQSLVDVASPTRTTNGVDGLGLLTKFQHSDATNTNIFECASAYAFEEPIFDENNPGTVAHQMAFVVIKTAAIDQLIMYDGTPLIGKKTERYALVFKKAYNVYMAGSLVAKMGTSSINTNGTADPKYTTFLSDVAEHLTDKAERLLNKGYITFDCLWYLFEVGNRFYTTIMDRYILGSTVTECVYTIVNKQLALYITGKVIKSDGRQLTQVPISFTLPFFSGLKHIDSLPIKPMTQNILDMLTARGKTFIKLSQGHHFKTYSGQFFQGKQKKRTTGRVMIDIESYLRFNEDQPPTCANPSSDSDVNAYDENYYQEDYYYDDDSSYVPNNVQQINEAEGKQLRYSTWPVIAGYCFSTKSWGEFDIMLLKEVVFDESAYGHLVMEASRKEFLVALLKDAAIYGTESTDFISSKGCGITFLLHGPPGTGKTLTAETVAEQLHQPLYTVTMGQLGTDAISVESNLADILELAAIWQAVILIDEADVFVEARNDYQIDRNALVSIFLRQLEYHQGIIFLTTNRVECFDSAILTRMSLGISYIPLECKERSSVWENLLSLVPQEAKTPDTSTEPTYTALGKYVINGRQIRSSIRLALALSRSVNAQLDKQQLEYTLHLTT